MQTKLDPAPDPQDPRPAPLKYEHALEFRSENNSHVQLLARVPTGAQVLELGCATGYMSEHLTQQKGCRVFGVDIEEAALRKAAAHCERTLCVDVESPDWQSGLGDARFDIILCADIIEHLKDPQTFLAGLRDRIKTGGSLLASVPNGAHAAIRLELLQGQLTYEDTGLLDRTHLHLYTHQSLMALLASSGYAVEALSYTFHDIPDEVLAEKIRQAGLEPTERALARLHAPEAIAYQFIVEARPRAADEPTAPFPELSDKPLRDSEEAYRKVHERLHETQQVAQHRQTLLENKERQVAHQQQQVEHLQRQLAHKDQQFSELTRRHTRQEQQLAYKEGRIGELTQRTRILEDRNASLHADKAKQQLTLQQLQGQLKRVRQQQTTLHQQHAALRQVLNTRSWRLFRTLTLPARGAVRLTPYLAHLVRNPSVAPQWMAKAVRLLRQGGIKGLRWHLAAASSGRAAPRTANYARWIEQIEAPREPDAASVKTFVESLAQAPLISVVMPVYEPRPEWLRAAIDSVLAQRYPHWELCIADDASPSPEIRTLLDDYRHRDPRIKVILRDKNGHIAAATNSALTLAEGDWVGFMDHDDLLTENALYHVAREIVGHPDARMLYSDEDKIDDRGTRSAHYFKPDFNPDLMLSHNLVCHFSVYRRDLLNHAGGIREGFEGAQDYDLALRCIAELHPDEIRHIPRILYHWRAVPGSTASGLEAKPYALDAAVRAVQDHLQAKGVQAEVKPSKRIEGMLRVRYPVPEPAPLVSLIIPTRNGLRLLRQCIDSVRAKTGYPNYEIIIVDNQSDEPATIEYLQQLQASGEARVVPYDKPFNYAALNNFAVAKAAGDYLCFLNNDIEVIEGDWLAEMVSHAARPEIGAVGARLLYPDGRLQHGGVLTGLGGVAGHAMKYLSGEAKGYNGRAVLVQNYSAVTAACMVMRREVFEQIGGFDAEHLGVAFNDVDLCLRIREQGYRNLWTPYAELYHHESATRGAENTAEKQARFGKEIAYMKSRWGAGLLRDPAYNPNLTLDREDFSLNWHELARGTQP
ncbi:MAG: glycosyltransferase [Chromatiaceae bacterium]|nr:glycosyltransferase [Chromatiaceae bacterium]MCP5315389.1 glycosyltransferase [Chromatiaceae bacterium]